MEISKNLEHNIKYIESLFENSGDIIKRKFPIGEEKSIWAYIILIDNLASAQLIESAVIHPLIYNIRRTRPNISYTTEDILEALVHGGIMATDLREETDFNATLHAVLSGDTAFFLDGVNKALIIASRGWASRGVPTAETEIVVQGSKEAFSESMRTNTMLLRRRVKDVNLVVFQEIIGNRTKTDIALVYLKDRVRTQVLTEVKKRLAKINTDAIFDIGYLEQFIEDDFLSPFPQGQVTERPDKAASAILEGRIVIVADNSPFVLIVPCVLSCFFQSPEDYYGRFEIMSLSRMLRYFAAIIATVLPGLYLSIALYSPNMIPTELLLAMTQSRESVPFPAIIEILLMDTAFELLREAGIRLPSAIGSTIGVVGGIIIGQAAVEAGLVSPIVVIIIALTAICGFTLPSINLTAGVRISKYLLIAGGAFLGLLGFWIGVLIILIHLASLKSFGFPYLYPFVSANLSNNKDIRDTIIRPPLFLLGKKSIFSKRDGDEE